MTYLEELSQKFGQFALKNNLMIGTAESCTAGLIAATIAMTSGSSQWLDSGFIVYTPQAKNKMLGVEFETIEKFNITSEEVAFEMAMGALANSQANFTISVTGVAGPNGGTDEIPVGTVCMAWAFKNDENRDPIVITEKKIFTGNRNEIREQVVIHVLNKTTQFVNSYS